MEAEKSTKKKKSSQFQRVYKGEQEFEHDLFKLEASLVEVDESPYENDWRGVKKEHKHFYHTFDSSGNKHDHSTPMLGHSHEISWDKDGNPICGPAVRQVRVVKHINGKKRRVKEWRRIDERSQHKHDVSYMVSEKIKPRKYSEQAAQAMSVRMSQEPAAPTGVE